jgi:hypothetical protein
MRDRLSGSARALCALSVLAASFVACRTETSRTPDPCAAGPVALTRARLQIPMMLGPCLNAARPPRLPPGRVWPSATDATSDVSPPTGDACVLPADATVPAADASAPPADATVPRADAAAPAADASAPQCDASAPPADASVMPPDAATPAVDAAAAQADASTPPDDGGSASVLDWNWPIPSPSAPVNATPAIYLPAYPASSKLLDRLFIGTQTTRGPNFFALKNLYASSPAVDWSATNNGMDGSAVGFDDQLTRVFVLDTAGALYCYDRATGGLCAGWSTAAYATGHGSSRTSPWFDYDSQHVFFADGAGILHKIDAATGQQTWEANLNGFLPSPACPGGCKIFGCRSSPIVYAGAIYMGNDGGVWYRIVDPGATAPTSANVTSQWLCGTPTTSAGCGADYAVFNFATLDVTTGTLYVGVNGYLFEYAISGGPYTHRVDLGAGHAARSTRCV